MDVWKVIRAIRNIAVVILILIVILALIVYLAPHVYLAADTKVSYLLNRKSGIYDLPITLEIKNANNKFEKFEQISRLDISFKVPFTNAQNNKETNSSADYTFDGNKSLSLNYYKGGFKLVENLKEKDSQVYNMMIDADGQKNFESEFAFTKYYLQASPLRLSLFSSKSRVNSEVALLSIKEKLIRNTGKGLYLYENDKVKAIQYGSPAMGCKTISIDIFDNKDNRYIITLPGDNITQDEIDYLLNSIEF